mgnify:CR=1 FL=1
MQAPSKSADKLNVEETEVFNLLSKALLVADKYSRYITAKLLLLLYETFLLNSKNKGYFINFHCCPKKIYTKNLELLVIQIFVFLLIIMK